MKGLFGSTSDVLLGAVYSPPQATGVHTLSINLADEIARALQETPNVVCGDFNAKVKGL